MSDDLPSYRPSNGSDGELFEEDWCAKCIHDAAFRADYNSADGCPILGMATAVDIDDPRYPKELVEDENGPRCKSFEPIEDCDHKYRCSRTVDMFRGAPDA